MPASEGLAGRDGGRVITARVDIAQLAQWAHESLKSEGAGVRLEVYRYDCQPGPVMEIPLDEAQAFLRRFQAAVDEAYRRQKEAFKAAARELDPEVTP